MISQEQAPPGQVLDEMVAAGEGSAQRIKVALFVASEVGPPSERHIRQTIECGRDVLLSVLSEHDIRHGELEKHDVLVVPGGKASIQGSALGGEGRSAIRSFVRGGGGYVGVCAGAYLATVNHEWSLRLINARTMTGERYVPRHGKEIGVSSFF